MEREKDRMKVKNNEKHKVRLEKLVCIGVDGKVDKETLVYREVKDANGEMKLKNEREQEHHLTFTKELGTESGTYLTHRVIPIKGAAGVLLGDEVVSVLEEFNHVHTLKAVLLDNTNTNTGWEGGLVTCLENKIQQKLHTTGCSLQQNELPFRAVFKHLDGSTKTPTTFSAPLGKLCEIDYQHQPQVEFTKFSVTEFDEVTLNDRSSDQSSFRVCVRNFQG